MILTFNCFILQRLCLFNLCFVFLGGVYFLLFKQPTGSFSINSEEATYNKSLMSTCCELIQEKCEYNHVYASINKINLTKCDIFKNTILPCLLKLRFIQDILHERCLLIKTFNLEFLKCLFLFLYFLFCIIFFLVLCSIP